MTQPGQTPGHKPLHIRLSDQGRFLSTREAGRAAVRDLERLTREPGDVILDFKEVEAATPPFLQQVFDFVAALIIESKGNGRIVLVAHLNEDLAETMRYVSAHAGRGVVWVHEDKLDLLEERPKLAETLREAQALEPFFTAPQLAKRLAIRADTATQRLRNLIQVGGAERQVDPSARQGTRHLYRVADPKLAA